MTDVPSEATPLLQYIQQEDQRTHRKKSWFVRHRLDVWIPIVFLSCLLVSVAVTFYSYVLPDIGEYAAQGTTFESQEINYLGISDRGGVNFEISGFAHNNYSQIQDKVAQTYFRCGGAVVRQLNMQVEDLDLLVFDQKKQSYNSVGRVHVSPFTAKIADGAAAQMDLYMTVYPDLKGLLGVIKKILTDPESLLKLKGDATVRIMLLNGFIPLTNVMIPLDLDLPKSLVTSVGGEDISISGFRLAEEAGSEDLVAQFDLAVLQNPVRNLLHALGISSPLTAPSSLWRLLMAGCEQPAELARVDTSAFDIVEGQGFNISCTGRSAADMSLLTEKCTDKDYSPLSKFIDGIVHNATAHLLLSAQELDKVPSQVSAALRKLSVPLNIPINVTQIASQVVKEVTMDDMSFELRDSETPVIDGTLKVTLDFGGMVSRDMVDFKTLRGTADLMYEGGVFGHVNVTEWKKVSTTQLQTGELLASCRLDDMVLDITDMGLFEEIVADVLQQGSAKITVEALLDVKVGSAMGEFELDGIPGSGDAEFRA